MAVRLFHQNMLNWGGISRAGDFIDAFGEMRTDTGTTSLNTDTVLAAGFTEITNTGVFTSTHMWDMCDKMQPPVDGVTQFNAPIFFASGTDINGDLYEYQAIVVNTAATVNAVGYTFLYVNPNDGHDYIVKPWIYYDIEAVKNLPPLTTTFNDINYRLATNYRCVAFVYLTYEQNDFIAGFIHNVCWAGEPGYVINSMPAIMDHTVHALNQDYRLPMIVGGDFNTLPRKISGGTTFGNIEPYCAVVDDIAVKTTGSSCIDFWLTNSTAINNDAPFSTDGCSVHPQAYDTRPNNGSRITDHKGISFAIL